MRDAVLLAGYAAHLVRARYPLPRVWQALTAHLARLEKALEEAWYDD